MWQGKDESLFTHGISGDNAGGVDFNHTCTVDNSGAVELGETTTA